MDNLDRRRPRHPSRDRLRRSFNVGEVADSLIAIQQQDNGAEASIQALQEATIDDLMTLAIELARRTAETKDDSGVWRSKP